MKSTESINNIIKDVEDKKREIASKNSEILTIQHQNVVLAEQNYIQKDKLYMLECELQDRKRIYDNLYIKYKKKNQNMVEEEFDEGDIEENAQGFHNKDKKANKNDKGEIHGEEGEDEEKEKDTKELSDLRILDGIQNYLDKQIQKHDRFRLMKQLNFSPTKGQAKGGAQGQLASSSDSESEEEGKNESDMSNNNLLSKDKQSKKQQKQLFNPFMCIQVRLKTSKQAEAAVEGQKQILSIRVEENTKFAEIKRAACQYWKIKDPNSKEVNGILTQAIQKDENFNYMDLCDETNSTLPDNQKVIQFMMQKGYKNLSQCTLILKTKEFRSGLESQQSESTKINKGVDQQKSQGQFFVTRVQVNSINPYDFFFQEYPSLKFYIELKQLHSSSSSSDSAEQAQEEEMVLPKGVTDSHCCILTFLIMIITVTAIYLSKMIDVETKHEANKYITQVMQLETTFAQYSIVNDVYGSFLKNVLGQSLFNSNYYSPYQGQFNDKFFLVGNMRIRFQRQILDACDIYPTTASQNACFNQDSVKLDKTDIGFGKHYQFQRFQNGPTDEAQRFTLTGTYGSYSPEGYMYDFNNAMQRETYNFMIDYLKSVLSNDYHLRVIIVSFTLFNPTYDLWVNINVIFELDRYGVLTPYKPKIQFFKPNIYRGTDGSTMLALDIIRLVSTLILLLFVIVQIYHFQLSYIISVLGFLNIVVIALSIASLVISFLSYSLGFDEDKLLNISTDYSASYQKLNLQTLTLDSWIEFQNKYFVDLTYVGYLYTTLQSIQAILITVLLFRFIFVFSFSIYLKTIVDTIKNAGNDLLKYFIIFLPLMISFAFIFYQIWGAKVAGYNNLIASLTSVVLMTIGYMNVNEINQVNTVWSIIFVMIFYLMIIFLLYTFILGILIESQHGVIMQKGYPSMQKTSITGVIIFQWLFQWVPESLKNKVRSIINVLKHEIQSGGGGNANSSNFEQDSNAEDKQHLLKEQLKGDF